MDINFNKNEDYNKLLVSDMLQKFTKVKLGGGQKRIDKLHAEGKMTARERIDYLLDDNGLINIRSKEVDLPLLNKEEVYKNYTFAQLITVGLPLIILAIFGFLFTFLRKRKYSR